MRIAIAGATGQVGSKLAALAEQEGHEVVAISREAGFDLLADDQTPVVEALKGADAAVDVTSTGGLKSDEETLAFFTGVARSLGTAAASAGVARTVTLSIVGVDRAPDYGYYVAKLAQEGVAREAHPSAVILRATQFHDFARQMFEWNRDGDVTRVIDVPTQPVDIGEIARLLLDQATGAYAGDAELAGPQAEKLVDLARRYGAHIGSDLSVEPADAPASLASGAMLPDNDGVLKRGIDWATWLAAQPTSPRS
jgi:uncharacterized protein YbjT (DUF2867 family)